MGRGSCWTGMFILVGIHDRGGRFILEGGEVHGGSS